MGASDAGIYGGKWCWYLWGQVVLVLMVIILLGDVVLEEVLILVGEVVIEVMMVIVMMVHEGPLTDAYDYHRCTKAKRRGWN